MKKMKVIESTMVKPISATPTGTMWISNLDVWMPMNYHTHTLYLYRRGAAGVFDSAVLKAALSRALVDFYPMAGRLQKAQNNRIEINCNGDGALFIEAEATDADMDDYFLGDDLVPRADVRLTPEVDYSKGISSYPLLLVQMTHFRCGGVCLGVAMDHHVCDGIAAIHFISTWSDIARGFGVRFPPFLDRTVLRAGDPPHPKFAHIEYHPPPPPLVPQTNNSNLKFSIFELTRDQLNALKTNYKLEGITANDYYSSFEVVAVHLWRCVSEARGLPEDQETKIYIPIDGRSRLQPPVPPGYLGNVVFMAAAVSSCGELIHQSTRSAMARKIREALTRMDDEYLRSALDYLEVEEEKEEEEEDHNSNASPHACPNLAIASWARMPVYDADFGWGKPVYVGLAAPPTEGTVFIVPSIDGGLFCAISMPEQQMNVFQILLYHIPSM